jgi:hypothetical protein
MAKEVVKETEDSRRSFDYLRGGEDVKYYLGMPTSEQIRKAEWHYSKMYNKALIDGVATQAEMIEILKNRGLYGPDHEEQALKLQTAIAENIVALEIEVDALRRRELAVETASLRNDLYIWNQRLTGPLSNSCEQMAEDSKTEYLTSVVIQDNTGNLVWDSYNSFIEEPDQALALKARYEVLLWLQGLEPDFLDNTPENQVLRDLETVDAENSPAQLGTGKDNVSTEEEVEKKPAKPKKKAPAKRRRKKTS